MMTSGPAGGGPDVVLDLLGSDLDLRAWVLSVTGRAVGSPPGPEDRGDRRCTDGRVDGSTGRGPLAPEVRARLAGEFLAAIRTERLRTERPARTGPPPTASPTPSSPSKARAPHGSSRFPYWLLAVEADAGDWPAERLDLLHGVTQLIAVERDRRDAARTVRRRLATEVLELVQAGAPPAEIAARLRVASPVLLPGLGAAPHWQVVVARVDGGGSRGAECRSLLEEILHDPRTTGAGTADRVAVAHTGEEAVALVPLPSRGPSPPGGDGETPGPKARRRPERGDSARRRTRTRLSTDSTATGG